MPISGPSSYLPTVELFLPHWGAVNAALGAGHEIVTSAGVTQTSLGTLRDSLSSARDNVTDMGVDRALAREELTALITKVQDRLVEFNARVRADLPGSTYSRILPIAFSVGDAEGTVWDTLRQMSRIWTRVNAISPAPTGLTLPLTLNGGYGINEFETDRTALRTAYESLSNANVALNLAREERNDLQDIIYEALKNYRAKTLAAFPNGGSLVDTLPDLTPAGGHTPDAVTATVVWDAPSTKAKITWTASAEATLSHYEVRGVPGDDYITADETVLASVAPADAREFLTDFALSVSGVTAGFKVYVVLNTGNEHGSDAVYVTRP